MSVASFFSRSSIVRMDGVKTPRRCQRPKMSPHVSSWKIAAQNYPDVELISIHAPVWARRGAIAMAAGEFLFQSTRPVWGATSNSARQHYGFAISIHAPRVGRDQRRLPAIRANGNFNPRAPCGARLASKLYRTPRFGFQSTRPVWGATFGVCSCNRAAQNFNPRAPCGARLVAGMCIFISCRFQSTRPVWGATISLPFPCPM